MTYSGYGKGQLTSQSESRSLTEKTFLSGRDTSDKHDGVEIHLHQRDEDEGAESSSAICEEKNLTPMSPLQLLDWRYSRATLHYSDKPQILGISAMRVSYCRPHVPEGWIAIEHPEGKLYYRHASRRILTHADICNSKTLRDIDDVYQTIQRGLRKYNRHPEDLELVVDFQESNGETEYCYYLASWKFRVIVWAEDVDIWYLTCNHRMVYCEAHLKHAVEWQFWNHIEMFPDGREISDNLVNHLSNMLSYGWNDLMTSEMSTTPYNADKIAELSRLIDIMKRGFSDDNRAVIVARNMATLCKEKFYNYHGQPGARLNRDESITEECIHRPRSLTFLVFSPLLFWMPDNYLAELETVWVDQTVNYRPWNKLINKLMKDWKASEIPAIVLLVVNASSLAIQNHYTTEALESTSTVAYYASTMLSLTSYIVGQILTRQHHAMMGKEDVSVVAQYLHTKSNLYFGLESPAFAFSLPTGCFIWSVLIFAFATSYNCFFYTRLSGRVINGILLLFLSSIVSLVLYMEWGASPSTHNDIRGSFLSILRRKISCVVFRVRVMDHNSVV